MSDRACAVAGSALLSLNPPHIGDDFGHVQSEGFNHLVSLKRLGGQMMSPKELMRPRVLSLTGTPPTETVRTTGATLQPQSYPTPAASAT